MYNERMSNIFFWILIGGLAGILLLLTILTLILPRDSHLDDSEDNSEEEE